MSTFSELGIVGFDYVEFAVRDLEAATKLHLRLGFEKTGTRQIRERGLTSTIVAQNDITILLSQSDNPEDPVYRFVQEHGDGICNVAFRCQDALQAFQLAVNRGATVAETPRSFQKDFGQLEVATIQVYGELRHTFLSRQGTLLAEGCEAPHFAPTKGFGLQKIDHLTTNVEKGKLDECAGIYERVFGLENTRFFDIHTRRTGLYSKVMESPDRVIKMPMNEPTDDQSQIQEFINVNHGPGIQHMALLASDILDSVPKLSAAQIPFLEGPPWTYYEALGSRVPNVQEDLRALSERGILVDGDAKGYLLQIFTQNLVGPFFYEVIQRKGHNGFGEGNFTALFESIERDQIRRGVLKP